jgi:hypothetical protein
MIVSHNGYGLDDQGSRIRFPEGAGNFFLTTASRTALGPTQPPIQWVPGTLSLGVKRPGREADHSPRSNSEVKERVELYLHSPDTPSWRGAQFKNSRWTIVIYFTLLTHGRLFPVLTNLQPKITPTLTIGLISINEKVQP